MSPDTRQRVATWQGFDRAIAVDRTCDSLAETIIGLYKTEMVRNRGPWRGLDDLELANLEWVDWFNHRRLFHELGRIPTRRIREEPLPTEGVRPDGQDTIETA